MSNYFDSLTSEERDEIRSRKPKNKTFYETVLDELDERDIATAILYKVDFPRISSLDHGLCSASKTFFKYFKNYDFREKIINHAKMYYDQSEFKTDFKVNDRCLHNYDDEFLFIGSHFKNIRIQFVKFCIENNLNIL